MPVRSRSSSRIDLSSIRLFSRSNSLGVFFFANNHMVSVCVRRFFEYGDGDDDDDDDDDARVQTMTILAAPGGALLY